MIPQVEPGWAYTRLRWPLVIASALPAPLIIGLVVVSLGSPVWLGVLEAAAGLALLVRRPRRRGLARTAEGLVVQRDDFRLIARWDDVAGVRVRRHQGLLRAEELVLAGSELQAIESRNRPSRLPSRVREAGADRHIQVSFYDKKWRTGQIGEELRRRGVID